MTRVSHLALWLAAVIVLIAVGLMPSGAEAHDGHRHAVAAEAMHAVAALPAPAAIATSGVAERMSGQARLIGGLACDGACCQSGCRPGTACCTGAGLAPETDESGSGRRPGDRALGRPLPARTDVVPEALPEPPRSIA